MIQKWRDSWLEFQHFAIICANIEWEMRNFHVPGFLCEPPPSVSACLRRFLYKLYTNYEITIANDCHVILTVVSSSNANCNCLDLNYPAEWFPLNPDGCCLVSARWVSWWNIFFVSFRRFHHHHKNRASMISHKWNDISKIKERSWVHPHYGYMK